MHANLILPRFLHTRCDVRQGMVGGGRGERLSGFAVAQAWSGRLYCAFLAVSVEQRIPYPAETDAFWEPGPLGPAGLMGAVDAGGPS